jgi:hypothetical protein
MTRAEWLNDRLETLGQLDVLELDICLAERAGDDVDELRGRVQTARIAIMRELAGLLTHPPILEIVH